MWWTLATALADPGALTPLDVVMDDAAPRKERVRAAKELGRLDPAGDERGAVVTPLATELESELPDSLSAAIRKTLGRLDATAVWTAELGSSDPKTRRVAARLLGQEGAAPAGDALLGVLKDPDARVRQTAAGALVAFPDTDSVDALAGCLGDPVIAVRLAASQTLGFLASSAAEQALLSARVEERDVVVKHYLDAAIGHIRRQQGTR